jgi:branched-chain amino acid transport system ATP-binding protein
MTSMLQVEGLSVSYGGVHAVKAVGFEVAPGQLVGLIGPNGAGKTSLIDALTGFVGFRGEAYLDGAPLSRLSAHARARLGLARTWQAAELFDDLTVRENLGVAASRTPLLRAGWDLVRGRLPRPASVDEVLAELGIEHLAEQEPQQLTEGQRKLVGVARALAPRPRMLLLDEPAAGLDSKESQWLGGELRRIVERGTSILLVDHDMGLVLSVCEQVAVLEFGEMIAFGTPDEVRREPRVIDAYLGDTARAALAEAER